MMLRQWQSEFFLRAEPERSGDGRAKRSQTARAWPRAAQQQKFAILFFVDIIEGFSFFYVKQKRRC